MGTATTVAVLGAGGLGTAMARRLGAQGRDVRVWNDRLSRTDGAGHGVDDLAAVARTA